MENTRYHPVLNPSTRFAFGKKFYVVSSVVILFLFGLCFGLMYTKYMSHIENNTTLHSLPVKSVISSDNSTTLSRKRRNSHFLPFIKDYPLQTFGDNCNAVFSELYLRRGFQNFVELHKCCIGSGYKKASKADKFKILGSTCAGETFLYADLDGSNFVKTAGGEVFLVLGSSLSSTSTMKFNHENVLFHGDDETQIFQERNNKPSVLFLIYGTKHKLKLLGTPKIPKSGNLIFLNDIQKSRIASTLQDAFVFKSTEGDLECPLFDEIIQMREMTWGPRRKTFVENAIGNDRSFSRCITHLRPLDVYGFKFGLISPLASNDCTQDTFLYQDELLEPQGPQEMEIDESETKSSPDQPRCLAVPLINSIIKKKHLPSLPELDAVAYKHRAPNNYLWLQQLDPAIVQHIEIHHSQLLDLPKLKDPKLAYCIELVAVGNQPSEYQYRCKICNLFCQHGNPDPQECHGLKSAEGIALSTKHENMKRFEYHAEEHFHIDVEDYVKECNGMIKRENLKTAVRKLYPPQERFTAATINFFQIVAQWVKSGFSFWQFKPMMQHFVQKGANVGWLHHHRLALRRVIDSISNEFFENLIHQLKERNPLTLMVDSYQDKRGRHILGVAFSMWYEGEPRIIFYHMLELTGDLTAKAMLDVMQQHWTKAGVIEDIKHSLIAFSSDGASTNFGIRQGLHPELEKWTGRKLAAIWCYGHRLNLVIKNTLAESQFIEQKRVIEYLNKVYQIFGPKTKARTQFRQRLKDANIQPSNLKKTHAIRWAFTYREAMELIYKFYEHIILQLQVMLTDSTVSADKKKTIRGILKVITYKNFPTTLGHLIDVFITADRQSKWVQRGDAFMINVAPMRNRYVAGVRKLRWSAEHLDKLLEDAVIPPIPNYPNRLNLFENAEGVTWRGIELTHDEEVESDSPILLSVSRPLLINRILLNIDEYFPKEQSLKYIMFHPTYFVQLPNNEVNFDTQIKKPFFQLLTDLNYDESSHEEIYHDWKTDVKIMLSNPNYHSIKKLRAHKLWLLASKDESLKWKDNTKKLVEKVLVLPSGIVDMERFFSQLGLTFSNKRLKMYVTTAASIMRLKQMLPDDTREWDAFPFVARWLKYGNCRVDDTNCKSVTDKPKSVTEKPVDIIEEEEDDDWDQENCEEKDTTVETDLADELSDEDENQATTEENPDELLSINGDEDLDDLLSINGDDDFFNPNI